MRATRAFVKQYLSDTITRAQSSIASYGAQYSERMFAALTTCQQGAWPCCSSSFRLGNRFVTSKHPLNHVLILERASLHVCR